MPSMDDLLGSLDNQAEEKQDQQDKAEQLDAVKNSGDKVVSAVNQNAQSTANSLKNVKGEVKVTNPDLSKTSDITKVVDSINKMNITTFMGSGGYQDMAGNMKDLASEVQNLQQKFQQEGLTSLSGSFTSLVNKLAEISKQLNGTKVSVDDSFTKAMAGLKKSIDGIDFKPSVNVSAPEAKVVTTPVDFKPVLSALASVEQAIKDSEAPETEIDLTAVTNGLSAVQGAITALRFPVPNYVLPFADPTGKAVQVKLDSSGNLPTSSGTILSAVRANISDQNTTITSSTAATTIVTADTTHYLDLVSLVLTNTSATGTEVTLFNDDGTTVRSSFYVPANDVRGVVFTVPFTQTAVNKTWQLKTVTSIASLKITAQFVKNS